MFFQEEEEEEEERSTHYASTNGSEHFLGMSWDSTINDSLDSMPDHGKWEQ